MSTNFFRIFYLFSLCIRPAGGMNFYILYRSAMLYCIRIAGALSSGIHTFSNQRSFCEKTFRRLHPSGPAVGELHFKAYPGTIHITFLHPEFLPFIYPDFLFGRSGRFVQPERLSRCYLFPAAVFVIFVDFYFSVFRHRSQPPIFILISIFQINPCKRLGHGKEFYFQTISGHFKNFSGIM